MKTNQLLLIDVPQTAETKRMKLTRFKSKHGIKTHRSEPYSQDGEVWIAMIPYGDDACRQVARASIEELMRCEEAGYLAFGNIELAAIRTLCEYRKIDCEF